MIGALNKRITVQELIKTPDGGGGFSQVWQSVASNPNIYAMVKPVSSSEQLSFHKLENNITHRIIIRYRADLNTAMRIINGTAVYDIKSIINIEGRNEYLEILATSKE